MKEENKLELAENDKSGENKEGNKGTELINEKFGAINQIMHKSINNDIKNNPDNKDNINLMLDEEEDECCDEATELISEEDKKEKNGLIRIINRLKEDLDAAKYGSLNQIYEQYLNNEDINKRNIKPKTTRKALIFMYYIISPLFSIINLVGVFESISILKILFQVIKNAIRHYYISLMQETENITKFSVNKFNDQYNFYNLFFEDSKRETFDFNLMMFCAFLGDILLKSRGFRISISIFAGINIVSYFFIFNFAFYDFDIDYNSYSELQILFLLSSWALLYIGVGASALLSQKIIIDSNIKYDYYKDKLNEESKKEWEKKKEEWGKKKHEKQKEQSEEQNMFIEIKEIKDEIKKNNEKIKNEINNIDVNENEIKAIKSQKNLNYIHNIDKDNDKENELFKIKKTNTATFKNIAKNIKSVQIVPPF